MVMQVYWIELAAAEKTLLALEPTNRIVPTTRTRITANIICFCLRRSTLTRRGTPLASLEAWRVASPTPRLNTKAGFINSMSHNQSAHTGCGPATRWGRVQSMCDGFGGAFKFRPLDKDDAAPTVRKAVRGKCERGPGGTPYNGR
jgi:hypothetical protein